MTRKWVFLVPVLVPLLFLATISTLDFNFLSYYGSSYCPSNNSVNWVITSGRLNLVQKTALESIFVLNPNVRLNIYIKEKIRGVLKILMACRMLFISIAQCQIGIFFTLFPKIFTGWKNVNFFTNG